MMKVNRQIIFVALSSLSGKKETNKNPDFDVSANLKYPNCPFFFLPHLIGILEPALYGLIQPVAEQMIFSFCMCKFKEHCVIYI